MVHRADEGEEKGEKDRLRRTEKRRRRMGVEGEEERETVIVGVEGEREKGGGKKDKKGLWRWALYG